MSARDKRCARCGERAETIDNIADTSFWGFVKTSAETVTSKSVRVASTYIRGHGIDSRVLTSDEEKPLCSPCWGLLVGQFLQGRPVAAVEHEHEWRRAGQIGDHPREVCDLCMQDRIAHEPGGSES